MTALTRLAKFHKVGKAPKEIDKTSNTSKTLVTQKLTGVKV